MVKKGKDNETAGAVAVEKKEKKKAAERSGTDGNSDKAKEKKKAADTVGADSDKAKDKKKVADAVGAVENADKTKDKKGKPVKNAKTLDKSLESKLSATKAPLSGGRSREQGKSLSKNSGEKSPKIVPSREQNLEPTESSLRIRSGRKSISKKYVGIPLEWDSQKIKDEEILSDGFTCCIVLAAEESSELSDSTELLCAAVNTGVRRRFAVIKASDIEPKVYQYMTSAKLREPGTDDDSYMDRMDIWAEAIKSCLFRFKNATELETVYRTKDDEDLGARSKDLLPQLPPLALTSPVQTTSLDLENTHSGTAEKPTSADKINNNEKEKVEGPIMPAAPLKGKEMKHPNKKEGKSGAVILNSGTEMHEAKSMIKKRGEIPMPILEQIDDVPVNGYKCYVILQGFHNVKLIPEMKKIGCPINGILLISTNSNSEKKNFSVYDIEENIAGSFVPHNVLPDYISLLQSRISASPDKSNEITRFWMELAALLNNAPSHSCLHDIALLNCPLPMSDYPLDTDAGRGIHAAHIYDEVAQRIYEMNVLLDWYKEYRQAVHVRQITPIEPSLSHTTYDRFMRQVPAECVTVPIIMESIVEQVMTNIGEAKSDNKNPVIDSVLKDKLNVNLGPDWGLTAYPKKGDSSKDSRPSFSDDGSMYTKHEVKPTFHSPKFIKNGDYASMRTAHLSEPFGSHLASSQVTGDFHRLESLLWQGLPEFSKGFHMKLLGNLNHFMYFLPRGLIGVDDMFFILHLLMSAGVEEHLQKLAEIKKKEAESEGKVILPNPLSLLINAHGPGSDVNYLHGTKLQSDHNYLTIDHEDALHFILAPMGKEGHMTISTLGQSKNMKSDTPESVKTASEYEGNETDGNEEEEAEFVEDADEEEESLNARRASSPQAVETEGRRISQDETKSTRKDSDKHGSQEPRKISNASTAGERKHSNVTDGSERKSSFDKQQSTVTNEKSAEEEELGGEDEEGTGPINPVVAEKPVEESQMPPAVTTATPQHVGFGIAGKKSGRFTSCDEQFYKDLNDYSTFQSLLECPALLAIGDNGALDLTKWVDSYLDSKGLTNVAGEGAMVGQLQDWNYIEEYGQGQLIQMLSEAIGNYLSLQRMYCPFYDTILFIFNNPTPYSLESNSSFVSRIQTLPGLQTFLEYTINDDDVLQWIMKLEKDKGVEVVDSFSVDTLLKIVPDDQWVLAPSIKERIIRRQLSSDRQAEELEKLKHEMSKPPKDSKKGDDKRKRSNKPDEAGDKTRKNSEEEPSVSEKKRKTSKREEKDKKSKSRNEEAPSKKARKKSNEEGKKERKSSNNKAEGKLEVKTSKTDEGSSRKERKVSKEEEPLLEDETDINTNTEKVKRPKTRKESFNFTDALKNSKRKIIHHHIKHADKPFECYDLGKRMVITAVDTFHLFPMDGSIIQYEMSTIEPSFRMMQLSVSKNGHQSFFYPYYIPRDLNISKESYVVCPYFHMVHSNGTIFAFQDHRAKEAAPYIRYCMGSRTHRRKFSIDKVVFAEEFAEKHVPKEKKNKLPSTVDAMETPLPTAENDLEGQLSDNENPGFSDEEEEEEEEHEADAEDAKGEKKDDPTKETSEDEAEKMKGKKSKKEKGKGKEKDKKKLKEKKGHKSSKSGMDLEREEKTETDNHERKDPESDVLSFQEDITGEWIYPASEESEDELPENKSQAELARKHMWEKAEKILTALVHSFKITFPSGLVIHISDSPGLPLGREVKQWYAAKGSASSPFETSRHYTSNGSVVKFMLNSTVQVINARGVTTTVREVSANVNKEKKGNVRRLFSKATSVKVFDGDVILATGEYWKIMKGTKFYHNPLFLFSGGQLPSGEIFRRRQDGVVYLHRHDGTVICHYPDGTRFTTRMVVNKDPVEEFEDWVFVGLKFLIEHPNYATVLFNTLSGNVHIKLPHGEWVRVFADASIKICCSDDYVLDVDRTRAVLTFPPCATGRCGDNNIPNTTVVKLFHHGIRPEESFNESQNKNDGELTQLYPTEDEEDEETMEPIIAPTNVTENINEIEAIVSPVRLQSGEVRRKSSALEEGKPSINNVHRASNDVNNGTNVHKLSENRSMASRHSRLNSLESNSNKSIKSFGENSLNRERSRRSMSIDEYERQSKDDIADNEARKSSIIKNEKLKKKKGTENLSVEKRAEIDKFLQFHDVWTFCKSIDSWENRFTIDVFGQKVIEKSEKFLSEMCVSTEKILDFFSLSSVKQPEPKPFVSGLLRSTSSETLLKMSRRLTALRQSKLGDCGKLPKTKIFVVKRDLSGYQYMKQSEVDSTVRKAKSQKESIIITDVLPSIPPRKFITIMQPMDATDKPNGLWHTVYREPVFRPSILTGKQLHLSKPEDLRWFGYVLSTAHGKRPKFVAQPKERYLRNKMNEEKANSTEPQQNIETENQDNAVENENIEGENEALEGKIEKEGNIETTPGVKNEVLNADIINPLPEQTEHHDSDGNSDSKHRGRKSVINKDKKKKHKKLSSSIEKEQSSLIEDDGSKDIIENDINEDSQQENKVHNRHLMSNGEATFQEYPDDVLDVEGIYDLESDPKPKITAENHVELCTRHKSIIVRNFVEIPKIDEDIQRAIIAASTCYGKTVKDQMEIYKTYELDDPNFEKERKRQRFIKQQLIEQNLEDMHLYEQEQGKVLSFHF